MVTTRITMARFDTRGVSIEWQNCCIWQMSGTLLGDDAWGDVVKDTFRRKVL